MTNSLVDQHKIHVNQNSRYIPTGRHDKSNILYTWIITILLHRKKDYPTTISTHGQNNDKGSQIIDNNSENSYILYLK